MAKHSSPCRAKSKTPCASCTRTLRSCPAEREWLKDLLQRYTDWLEQLPPADRESIVDEDDPQARLAIIKELRESEWIARQPKTIRQYLEKPSKSSLQPTLTAASTVGLLAGPPRGLQPIAAAGTATAHTSDPYRVLVRAEAIKRLKQEETRKARDWLIAARHWSDLTDLNFKNRAIMPTHPGDFDKGKDKEIETFIKEYLWPVLSPDEQKRLKGAEGQWPLYPLTLVELADRHPMALPHRNGPKKVSELPTVVQERISKLPKPQTGKVKDYTDQFFKDKKSLKQVENRLSSVSLQGKPTDAMKFACSVATLLNSKKGPPFKLSLASKLPYELWASRPDDMSNPMLVFLSSDPANAFWLALTSQERTTLKNNEGKWPEYPLKIQDLATKYNMSPPWQTLPDVGGKRDLWNRYRVKPHTRFDFSATPLSKTKRDAPGKEGDEK